MKNKEKYALDILEIYSNGKNDSIDCIVAKNFLNIDCCSSLCDICKARTKEWLEQEYVEPKPQILNKEEKEYLENFIRPFKDKIIAIKKKEGYIPNETYGYIMIYYIEFEGEYHFLDLPYFDLSKDYKGMYTDAVYTLKELGLFGNE